MSGLFVSELALSHFRSHKHAQMTPDGRPIAIWGPNGAGKTNILEAVSLLSPGRGLRRAASEDMIRRPEALGWKVAATLRAGPQMHEVETWAKEGGARQVRIDGKPAPQVALGRIARILWLVPAMDRLWIEGADGRRRFLDRATMSFDPGHADMVLTYEKAMRERNRLLKDAVRDPAWYGALESQMARAGAAIQASRHAALDLLAGAQEEAETAFPAADLALIHPETTMPETQSDLITAFAEGRARDLAAGRTLNGPHRTDLAAIWRKKGVAAKDCSTGEQKALLVSLILANARALTRDLGAPPILLLDEVAAHLDAQRRAALFDEICVLGAQAWMSATEPVLFTGLGARAQYIEVSEVAGASSIRERTMP